MTDHALAGSHPYPRTHLTTTRIMAPQRMHQASSSCLNPEIFPPTQIGTAAFLMSGLGKPGLLTLLPHLPYASPLLSDFLPPTVGAALGLPARGTVTPPPIPAAPPAGGAILPVASRPAAPAPLRFLASLPPLSGPPPPRMPPLLSAAAQARIKEVIEGTAVGLFGPHSLAPLDRLHPTRSDSPLELLWLPPGRGPPNLHCGLGTLTPPHPGPPPP